MTIRSSLELAHSALTNLIIGGAHHVYNRLGEGLFESVYVRALGVALEKRGLSYELEKPYSVMYEGVSVGEYRADLVVAGTILVEAKAVDAITKAHLSQTLNYLRVARLPLALLINFGPKPQVRRLFL